jgi:antitoxin ParD1/3/4
MATMNVSLPDELKGFAEGQAQNRGFAGTSDYVRDLIRRDQERVALRELLLAGAQSPPSEPLTAESLDRMRARTRRQSGSART